MSAPNAIFIFVLINCTVLAIRLRVTSQKLPNVSFTQQRVCRVGL